MQATIALSFLVATENPQVVKYVVVGAIAIVGIIAWAATIILSTRAKERTKQEIAAYVAEGTIDPKQAVKLIKAGRSYSDAMSDAPWMKNKTDD